MNRSELVVVVVVGIVANQSYAFVPARNSHVPARTTTTKTTTTQHTSFTHVRHPLFGILDDMRESADDEVAMSESILLANHPEFQNLYHDLIFSTDLSQQITKTLGKCTNPKFLEFLYSLQECTKEEVERQGLEELMGTIRATQTKWNAEDEAQKAKVCTRVGKDDTVTRLQGEEDNPPELSSSTAAADNSFLSNADIIKRANQIDKAVAAAALSDDEKPSDFISDCRDVVNLSRGFNNQGQMRVGGR